MSDHDFWLSEAQFARLLLSDNELFPHRQASWPLCPVGMRA